MKQAVGRLAYLFIIFGCIVRVDGAAGSLFYVSADAGNDTNPGTLAAPFRTIQRGLDKANRPGDAVVVRSGRYPEQLHFRASGNASGPITLEAYPGETPALVGPGSKVHIWVSISIANQSYVNVIGMACTDVQYDTGDYSTSDKRGCIQIRGGDNSSIQIRNNHIYDLKGPGSPSEYANIPAVRVVGTSSDRNGGLTDVIIDHNLIHDIDANNSEAVQIKGNVNDWQITNNEIYHIDNILIEMLGWDLSLTVEVGIPPRNGLVSGNFLHDSVSFGGAAGIYNNGATNVVIENNKIANCYQGISINSENAAGPPEYKSRNVTIQNNVISNCLLYGIVLGSLGNVDRIIVRNNSVLGSGTPLVVLGATNSAVTNNVFTAAEGQKIADLTGIETDLLDFNVYDNWDHYSPDAVFQSDGTTRYGFASYREAIRQEGHSLFGNPAALKSSAGYAAHNW